MSKPKIDIKYDNGAKIGEIDLGQFNTQVVQTTDATKTNLYTFPVPVGELVVVEALVVGRQTTGEVGVYKVVGAADNTAGTTALIGASTQDIVAIEDVAGWAVDVEINDTTDEIEVTVTGAVGDTVNWSGKITIYQV